MSDDRLEELSDQVRKGESIGFSEALEVIAYQETLREERSKSLLARIKHWFKWNL